jgi:hypothetical protein
MKSLHTALPLWVRVVLLSGVICIVAGAGLIAYRLYEQPATLRSRWVPSTAMPT